MCCMWLEVVRAAAHVPAALLPSCCPSAAALSQNVRCLRLFLSSAAELLQLRAHCAAAILLQLPPLAEVVVTGAAAQPDKDTRKVCWVAAVAVVWCVDPVVVVVVAGLLLG